MEAELARQSLKPNRTFSDSIGVPVAFDQVRDQHCRQAGAVGAVDGVDSHRQASDAEVTDFLSGQHLPSVDRIQPSTIRAGIQSRGSEVRSAVEAKRAVFEREAEIERTEDGTLGTRKSLLKQSGKQVGTDASASIENAKDAVRDLWEKR
jgi:conjugal transfer mating pair stabilization protein TraG